MLISTAAVLAMQVVAGVGSIGMAADSSHGQMCVAMAGAALTPGATITLVQHYPRQATLVATIERAVPVCEPLDRAMIS